MMSKLPPNISFDLREAQQFVSGYASVGVLVDENTREHCYPLISEWLPDHVVIEIRSGEINKNLDTCRRIWQVMTEHAFDRRSLLINLGGGVIGDMGGFCAATFKRGIDFMNLPTTLLAQVDASVGGKLGIDFMGLKNHIGLFRDPRHIVIYPAFLETLPANELRSGFAEVIKHHLISDAEGWQRLRKSAWKDLDWNGIIRHSVSIKTSVVEEDPYESGLRKILNLGHTAGHAIESYMLTAGQPVLHGEAVAAGIVCENYIASEKKMLSQQEKADVEAYILSQYGKIVFPERDHQAIIRQAYQDKKNMEKEIRAVLLKSIGEPEWDIPVSGREMLNALEYYQALQIP